MSVIVCVSLPIVAHVVFRIAFCRPENKSGLICSPTRTNTSELIVCRILNCILVQVTGLADFKHLPLVLLADINIVIALECFVVGRLF